MLTQATLLFKVIRSFCVAPGQIIFAGLQPTPPLKRSPHRGMQSLPPQVPGAPCWGGFLLPCHLHTVLLGQRGTPFSQKHSWNFTFWTMTAGKSQTQLGLQSDHKWGALGLARRFHLAFKQLFLCDCASGNNFVAHVFQSSAISCA